MLTWKTFKTIQIGCLGSLLMTMVGCGESACDRLESLKCDCHQMLCDEAVELDTNKKDDEACERAVQKWDCESVKTDRNLDLHQDWKL